jgi:hypothetical protein
MGFQPQWECNFVKTTCTKAPSIHRTAKPKFQPPTVVADNYPPPAHNGMEDPKMALLTAPGCTPPLAHRKESQKRPRKERIWPVKLLRPQERIGNRPIFNSLPAAVQGFPHSFTVQNSAGNVSRRCGKAAFSARKKARRRSKSEYVGCSDGYGLQPVRKARKIYVALATEGMSALFE